MNRLNRMTVQKDIRSLIGTNASNTKSKFEPERTASTSPAKLRIPDHQRFYIWPESKQAPLIDSIMNNCPLPLMVFTEQMTGSSNTWFVQDGQQRLITMQKYMMGEFTWNGQRYADLEEDDRLNFLSYTVTCEIIQNPTTDQIAEIFERLNCGKPLTDNDKFWNRRESPAVSFALTELMHHSDLEDHFKKYGGKVGAGKSRSQLSDLVGAVVAISKRSVDCIATSFDKVGQYVCDHISEDVKQFVISVFKEYFAIVNGSLQRHSVAKPRKFYLKLSGMLGIYLFWRLHPEHFGQEEPAQRQTSIQRWDWFAWKLQDKNFKKDYFAPLSSGHQRNIDREALKARTAFLISSGHDMEEEVDDDDDSDDDDDDDNSNSNSNNSDDDV
jgi:hypothetical protein